MHYLRGELPSEGLGWLQRIAGRLQGMSPDDAKAWLKLASKAPGFFPCLGSSGAPIECGPRLHC